MSGQHVLLTGGTGFVGKVVLYELIRRRQELNIERITLIVREGGRGSASARLRRLKRSRAFAGLPSKSLFSLRRERSEVGQTKWASLSTLVIRRHVS